MVYIWAWRRYISANKFNCLKMIHLTLLILNCITNYLFFFRFSLFTAFLCPQSNLDETDFCCNREIANALEDYLFLDLFFRDLEDIFLAFGIVGVFYRSHVHYCTDVKILDSLWVLLDSKNWSIIYKELILLSILELFS